MATLTFIPRSEKSDSTSLFVWASTRIVMISFFIIYNVNSMTNKSINKNYTFAIFECYWISENVAGMPKETKCLCVRAPTG